MKSVETAFAVLEEVGEHQPVGVSDVARFLGLPKSTVQRSLRTLHALGWIRSDAGTPTRWMLTARSLSLGGKVMNGAELRPLALPVMQRLAAETAETIHLTVPDGRDVVLIDKVDSTKPVRTWSWIGGRAPIHASSSGKAVLAHLPEAQRRSLLEGPLERFTERTQVDTEQLEVELEEIRRLGYATNEGEWRTDVFAVGAAIVDASGNPMGAVSISMPSHRAPDGASEIYGPLVLRAVREISPEAKRP